MSTAINEALIRDVVQEVLGRLGGATIPTHAAPVPGNGKGDCGCHNKRNGAGKHFGVFQDAAEACSAAADAFVQLQEKGVEARRKIVDIVKTMWRIVYSDDDLHEYEGYLVRKLADLLGLEHHVMIKAKLEVQKEIGWQTA